jgi:hypothetical protein
VYATLSPAFENALLAPLLSSSRGWNRFVDWLSLPLISFGNPAG